MGDETKSALEDGTRRGGRKILGQLVGREEDVKSGGKRVVKEGATKITEEGKWSDRNK